MNIENNKKLLTLAKFWRLNGDWMQCTACDRGLVASRDGEALIHKPMCKNSRHVHPWVELREAIMIGD